MTDECGLPYVAPAQVAALAAGRTSGLERSALGHHMLGDEADLSGCVVGAPVAGTEVDVAARLDLSHPFGQRCVGVDQPPAVAGGADRVRPRSSSRTRLTDERRLILNRVGHW